MDKARIAELRRIAGNQDGDELTEALDAIEVLQRENERTEEQNQRLREKSFLVERNALLSERDALRAEIADLQADLAEEERDHEHTNGWFVKYSRECESLRAQLERANAQLAKRDNEIHELWKRINEHLKQSGAGGV